MKHELLSKNGNSNLTIFFAGWGMDNNPFTDYRSGKSDILICFDYSNLHFKIELLDKYKNVRVVAWSLGVWVASALQAKHEQLRENAVAINGTPFPVDEERGIPPSVFEGTLKGLSEKNLARFNRRMCANSEKLAEYELVRPKRSIPSLSTELAFIGSAQKNIQIAAKFKRAYAGKLDAIFSCQNQINAWESICPVEVLDVAHYDRTLLRNLICGEDL
ncbi:MAG: DUF452 family protein [Lentisphaerae bacterium]|nr:DUF452 family protein [Lentisphaerota bacterium]